MINSIDNFYLQQEEPNQSCLMALRQVIRSFDDAITEHWKWRLPFFYYSGNPFCYLWIDKKSKHPYIGIVKGIHIDHPRLELGNRTKMKIFSIDPNKDLPVEEIYEVFEMAKTFYK